MDIEKEMAEKKGIRVMLMSDIHYCKDGWYGMTQKEKRELLCADLEREYENDPYEALFLLGDYSLDHWAWLTKGTYLTQGISDAKRFKEECLARMAPKDCRVHMLAGNHEQYGEALWESFTGFQRQGHYILGSVLFIFLDTFGRDLDPVTHSDGTYIGADTAQIKKLMALYPDKRVVLCAHWFDMERESEDFLHLLGTEERILCLFCGHNHRSAIAYTPEDCGKKPIIFTGHYSYSGEKNPISCLCGYRELVITDEGLSTKYIVPAHTYTMGNVKFTTEYAEQDQIDIKF